MTHDDHWQDQRYNDDHTRGHPVASLLGAVTTCHFCQRVSKDLQVDFYGLSFEEQLDLEQEEHKQEMGGP